MTKEGVLFLTGHFRVGASPAINAITYIASVAGAVPLPHAHVLTASVPATFTVVISAGVHRKTVSPRSLEAQLTVAGGNVGSCSDALRILVAASIVDQTAVNLEADDPISSVPLFTGTGPHSRCHFGTNGKL